MSSDAHKPVACLGMPVGVRIMDPLDRILDQMFRTPERAPIKLQNYEAVRAAARAFVEALYKNAPHGMEREEAVRKIREALFWADQAILHWEIPR